MLVLIGLSDMEMKREADSNDISVECSHDDKPTVGMFVCCFFSQKLFVTVWRFVVFYFTYISKFITHSQAKLESEAHYLCMLSLCVKDKCYL